MGACRVDALAEESKTDLGVEHRLKVEARIRQLEGGVATKISGTSRQSAKFEKYENKSEVVEYKAAADSTLPSKKRKSEDLEEEVTVSPMKRVKVEEVEEAVSEKKKKKKKEEEAAEVKEEEMDVSIAAAEGDATTSKKKKKKKAKEEAEAAETTMDTTADLGESFVAEDGEKKKKNKKKKEKAEES